MLDEEYQIDFDSCNEYEKQEQDIYNQVLHENIATTETTYSNCRYTKEDIKKFNASDMDR